MKLGLQLGYWHAQPPTGHHELVTRAEAAGFDMITTAESWGSDALTPLAWLGASTTRVRLGTSVVQLSARTPTACAMAALTLDHLSEGRHVLGLGVSGPQVVEGWYGQSFAKPLARTREYVEIVRAVLERAEPVSSPGPHYPLPYTGADASGRGKPLKSITHPRRPDIPIWLGAEGPKNVAQTAEVADGWLTIFYTPRLQEMYNSWLDEGFARPGARRTRENFEVAATATVVITDDRHAALRAMKPTTALYVGGMGAEDMNFHAQVYGRMGYADVVEEVTSLFRTGRKDRAAEVIPDQMVADTTLVGTVAEVREQVLDWERAGVTMLLVTCRTPEEIDTIAECVLGATRGVQ
ncbi:MAG: LLM class F420-dependent oxidoreductase [Rhodococcus sp. (in: high G+C Gram-positive bacteria)]